MDIRFFILKRVGKVSAKEFATREKVARRTYRRLFERFSLDHKHLTMLSEQDILLLRDLSYKGFSTIVAKSSTPRFAVGDIFTGKLRYHKEIYKIDAVVVWKSDDTVGFEFHKIAAATQNFVKRVIRPIEIARSFEEVGTEPHSDESGLQRYWYHGDHDSDLFVWMDDADDLQAWQLAIGDQRLDWSSSRGLRYARKNQRTTLNIDVSFPFTNEAKEMSMNSDFYRFASDIFLALDIPIDRKLITSLEEAA